MSGNRVRIFAKNPTSPIDHTFLKTANNQLFLSSESYMDIKMLFSDCRPQKCIQESAWFQLTDGLLQLPELQLKSLIGETTLSYVGFNYVAGSYPNQFELSYVEEELSTDSCSQQQNEYCAQDGLLSITSVRILEQTQHGSVINNLQLQLINQDGKIKAELLQ